MKTDTDGSVARHGASWMESHRKRYGDDGGRFLGEYAYFDRHGRFPTRMYVRWQRLKLWAWRRGWTWSGFWANLAFASIAISWMMLIALLLRRLPQ